MIPVDFKSWIIESVSSSAPGATDSLTIPSSGSMVVTVAKPSHASKIKCRKQISLRSIRKYFNVVSNVYRLFYTILANIQNDSVLLSLYPSYPLTFLPSYLLSFSPSHLLTLSPSHLLIFSSSFPMPYALCPMPISMLSAPCPMLHALCPLLSAPSFLPSHLLIFSPSIPLTLSPVHPMLHALCSMLIRITV